SIGGFLGTAEYEGELAEFLPYLQAAKWTGVGRQSVWGKGEISVESWPPNLGAIVAADAYRAPGRDLDGAPVR
ncbi:MAG: hypothetical protein JWO80_61, partial [Bryobacterales bacterium]|nr:hypothetical protein [Bryobacterales bacterium]